MQTTQNTSESILQHHLEALGNNDLEALMEDYTETSEVWTPDGPLMGLKEIASFFTFAFTLFPKGSTTLELKKMIAQGNKVYIIWTADSPIVNVSFATDSLEIIDGKITWQSTAFQMFQK